MNTKINYIKVIKILLPVSLVCLVYLYYQTKNPSYSIVSNNVPTTTPSLDIKPNQPVFNSIKKYKISLNFDLDTPKNLTVYEAKYIPEDLNSMAQQLIKSFKLKAAPNSSIRWTSNDNNENLYIDYKNQYLHYANSRNNWKFSERLDEKVAIKTAQTFYQKNFPSLNFGLTPSFVARSYAPASGRDSLVAPPEKANYYTISFNNLINGIPYFQNANLQDALNISVSSGNIVTKFTYHSQPLPSLLNPRDYQTVSKDRLINLLESGAGEVVYADVLDIPPSNEIFPEITLRQHNLEYRFNETRKLIIPYYRFYGTFISPYTQKASYITIILPAVEL